MILFNIYYIYVLNPRKQTILNTYNVKYCRAIKIKRMHTVLNKKMVLCNRGHFTKIPTYF